MPNTLKVEDISPYLFRHSTNWVINAYFSLFASILESVVIGKWCSAIVGLIKFDVILSS